MAFTNREEQTELPLFGETTISPSPAKTVRLFTDWETSVLSSTVAFLARDWNGKGSLDLSDHLILVPTKNAGRRLREALAIHAAKFDSAVLPPLVVTPDFLYAPSRLVASENQVASPLGAELLWTGLFLQLPLDEFRRVFPIDPVERSLKWANDNARELLRVRNLLVESDLDFQKAAAILASQDLEAGRWTEFSVIEKLAITQIEKAGFRDPAAATHEAAERGELPAKIRHLVVASIADLKPLASRVLTRYAERFPIHILIHAPESEAAHFDPFGRPLPAHWLTREIVIQDPAHSIHQCTNPADQAELCRELLAPYSNPASLFAIGIPDPEVAPTLEQQFLAAGHSSYDPAGKPVSHEGIYYLLKLTHQLVTSERFSSLSLLLRCPGVIDAALQDRATESRSSSGTVLRHFDKFSEESLPDRLSDALLGAKHRASKYPALATIITWSQRWITRFRKEDFTSVVNAYLSEIFSQKRFHSHDPSEAVFIEVAAGIQELASELDSAEIAFPRPPDASDHFELLLSSLAERRVYPDRGPLDIDLQGWLELLWEDAPQLLLTGMNDHAVPEAIIGHAFLPDSARRVLGIQNNDDRFARDAYLLTSILETRNDSRGRVDLLFGRQGTSGDPLRPSRLLFQCHDSDLAERTLDLFSEQDHESQPLPRSIAWKLKPAPLAPDHRVFQRISVTGFKQYLTCPFRYYLKFGLGMEKVESGKNELSAADFGNLVHAVLEALGQDEQMRDSTDDSTIAQFFEREIDQWLQAQFGFRLTTPVMIQREAARQRLSHWSKVEAAERAKGWRILAVEVPFGKDDTPFTLNGMTVTGRVDRIEQHPEHGIRVFDFKTISPMEDGRIKTVDRYHLANVKRTEDVADFPDWALSTDAKGKAIHWVDLQIPLYCLAMAERYPGITISAGYITLGRTEAEVRIDLWDALDDATIATARTCAEGVIDSIRNQRFWPPNEQMPKWDDFKDLLSPTATDAVDPRGLDVSLDPVPSPPVSPTAL